MCKCAQVEMVQLLMGITGVSVSAGKSNKKILKLKRFGVDLF